MKIITTDITISELYKAFSKLNEIFYDNSLPFPFIVIVETLKKNAYGWFTPNKVWTNENGTIQMHEIALSAEFMNRGFLEVIQTLHHEMIHLYCHTKKIKDTKANGKYHTTSFKVECIRRGFYFEDSKPDDKLGWSFAKLTNETKEKIKSFNLNEEAFSIARAIRVSKKNNSQIKYGCACGHSFRGKKGLNLMCCDCEENLVEI